MQLLDGQKLAALHRKKLKEEIEGRATPEKPGLACILIGQNPASHLYVERKRQQSLAIGIHSEVIVLPEQIGEEEVRERIERLNLSAEVDGILIQQPLPPHLDPSYLAEAVSPEKDVDGLHPLNLGKLLVGREDGFIPCTPLAIAALLTEHAIALEGKQVVIIGRSTIVGKPLALLLGQKKRGYNATVTLAHSASSDLPSLCQQGDILVAALGKPAFITASMVKPGACVIDVGINRIGGSLVGDVAFSEVAAHCSAITPVPGGVGPMTVAMLLSNTWLSYCRRRK